MKNEIHSIRILPPEEARRIAAGEVIDRPAALVREFLDNAIDSGAANIDVLIEEGGCKKTEVSDDGDGMSLKDLELCSLTHATSKIRGLDDLNSALTLGFRGEALAAISSVARLEIITSVDGRQAYRLETGPGENNPPKYEQTRRTKGTTVRAQALFESIPARKRFLKREGSEGTLCRQIFIDKALAFNAINFRYLQDGKLKDFLPAVDSKKKRFTAAIFPGAGSEENYLHEINVTGDGFSAVIVIGGPQLYRNDRRQLYVFANGRRVQDFSLIQAMEYGAQGWFPNGTHPVGAVYVEIDPSLADFNIHPAKREVRFRDPGAIHHAVSRGIKSFFHMKTTGEAVREKQDTRTIIDENEIQTGNHYNARSINKKDSEFNFSHNNSSAVFSPVHLRKKFNDINLSLKESAPVYGEMKYAGRVFGLFILIEWADKLYIIDQHAAHERILYNKFLSEDIPKQELLAPIPFTTESKQDDDFLSAKTGELSSLGIDIKKDGESWRIEALPADWRLSDAATVKEILELQTASENMAQRWAAALCCRCAIKDGDYPDDETAFNLGREALALSDPHCPHGRPIWTEISRSALYKAVRRE